MRMLKVVACMAVAAAGVLAAGCLTGCSLQSVRRVEDRELEHPLIRKALARERAGDPAGAIRAYRDALLRSPQLARAHMGLALLLDQPDGDYLLAIYHYQQYLELRPSSEKREMLEARIRMAKISFAAAMFRQPISVAERITELENELAKLKTENGNLTAQLKQSRIIIAQLQQRGRSGGGSVTRDPSGEPTPRPAGMQPAARMYRVEPGDTLTRIAQKAYGNPDRWRDIFEANRSALPTANSVRVGQVLVLP